MIANDDGSQLALVDDARVLIVDIPALRASAEITIEGGAGANDVAFAGDTLVVLTRHGGRATLFVVDPRGPKQLGELAWRGPARILAACARHVLIGTATSTVLVGLDPLEVSPLPVRGAVTAASRLGGDRFIVASEGVLEEWDAVTRTPSRRLKLDRRYDPQLVGGNALRFWMIRRSEPDQIDVVTLARHAPRRFALVEPVKSLAVHARGDLALAIGAETGMPFVIDLAQADPISRIGLPSVREIAWTGRGRTIAFVPLGGALALLRVPGTTQSEADVAAAPKFIAPEASCALTDDLRARLAAWRARQQGLRFAGQR